MTPTGSENLPPNMSRAEPTVRRAAVCSSKNELATVVPRVAAARDRRRPLGKGANLESGDDQDPAEHLAPPSALRLHPQSTADHSAHNHVRSRRRQYGASISPSSLGWSKTSNVIRRYHSSARAGGTVIVSLAIRAAALRTTWRQPCRPPVLAIEAIPASLPQWSRRLAYAPRVSVDWSDQRLHRRPMTESTIPSPIPKDRLLLGRKGT